MGEVRNWLKLGLYRGEGQRFMFKFLLHISIIFLHLYRYQISINQNSSIMYQKISKFLVKNESTIDRSISVLLIVSLFYFFVFQFARS